MVVQPGIAVDAHGGAVIDPTENVKALNEASHKRQDDLRELYERLTASEVKRVEQLSNLQAIHLKEIATLHQDHDRAIHKAEQERLNSIRQNDLSAVRTESERSQTAIQALAASQARDAETLRATVQSTSAALAQQTAQQMGTVSERVAALEKTQYTGMGKESVIDPQMERLSKLVEDLVKVQASAGGKSAGFSASWAALLGFVALLSGMLGIGGVLFALMGR